MAAQIPDHLHLGCGLRAPAGWLNRRELRHGEVWV